MLVLGLAGGTLYFSLARGNFFLKLNACLVFSQETRHAPIMYEIRNKTILLISYFSFRTLCVYLDICSITIRQNISSEKNLKPRQSTDSL